MEDIPKSVESIEIKFPEIAGELKEMVDEDQVIRQREIDDSEFDGGDIDVRNAERMKEIVTEIGWPTISKVGRDASTDAWLLVQHADHDIEFQKQCLSLMLEQPAGEVEPHDIAYLTDRVKINNGELQIYGTQFKKQSPPFIPEDMEDPEHVDERRAVMGLRTLTESTDDMYRKYKIEKPIQ